MINIKELRVGNFVLCEYLYGEYRIDEIVGIYHGMNSGAYFGIPIDEKILLAAGFTKWDDSNVYSKEFNYKNSFQIRGKEVYLGGIDSCTTSQGFVFEIEYVHQLQNAHYILTNEELDLNLKAESEE